MAQYIITAVTPSADATDDRVIVTVVPPSGEPETFRVLRDAFNRKEPYRWFEDFVIRRYPATKARVQGATVLYGDAEVIVARVDVEV